MIHECAVPGCGTSIVAGMLMCKVHWYQVTPRTRAWVNHSWREACSKVADPIRRLELIREHRAAKERAIVEVQRKQEEIAQ
ncbi:MAG: hypothetical protein IT530_16080 [Burkholderiales bacterium]|nr:hypothetical protein [Burkholderiales bacterium]